MVIAPGFLALFSLFIVSSPVSAAPSSFGSSRRVCSSDHLRLCRAERTILSQALERRNVLWGNCSTFGVDSQDPNLSCGYYEVPMDYHDPNAGKARLAVAKYAVPPSQKIGTLFANPGG